MVLSLGEPLRLLGEEGEEIESPSSSKISRSLQKIDRAQLGGPLRIVNDLLALKGTSKTSSVQRQRGALNMNR